jgi:hypothetical protein
MKSRTGTALTALVVCASLALAACSSSATKKDAGLGRRSLDCVVIQKEREASGSSGARSDGSGNYFLVFETREGEATSRYRFQVSRQQWFRFDEGSRVRITLVNNILQDIRPNE